MTRTGLLAIACCLLSVSCSDTTSPATLELQLDFCASDAPTFFAVKNEGSDWKSVTANAAATYTFAATQKVAIAYVRQTGTSYTTTVIFAGNIELLPLKGVACEESVGTRSLTGSLAGLATGQIGLVAM